MFIFRVLFLLATSARCTYVRGGRHQDLLTDDFADHRLFAVTTVFILKVKTCWYILPCNGHLKVNELFRDLLDHNTRPMHVGPGFDGFCVHSFLNVRENTVPRSHNNWCFFYRNMH